MYFVWESGETRYLPVDREIAVISSDGVEDVLNLPEEILRLSESCSLDVCKLPIYTPAWISTGMNSPNNVAGCRHGWCSLCREPQRYSIPPGDRYRLVQ